MCSHLHSKPWGQVRVELGGWLEPALRAATAPPWILSWPGSLSCITGSGWLRAQAAFRAAGWAAESRPSARGERGGLFYKSTHQLKSRTLTGHKTPMVFMHRVNTQQSWKVRVLSAPLLWVMNLPKPELLSQQLWRIRAVAPPWGTSCLLRPWTTLPHKLQRSLKSMVLIPHPAYHGDTFEVVNTSLT